MKIYKEFVGFYRYKGEVLGELAKRRKAECYLFLLNSYLLFFINLVVGSQTKSYIRNNYYI